jgi:hypothetical protein
MTYKNCTIKKSFSKAGGYGASVMFPNGDVRIFKNFADARFQIDLLAKSLKAKHLVLFSNLKTN